MPRRFDSGPAGPVEVSISEEPPIAPVAVSFDDEAANLPSPASSNRISRLRRIVAWCVDGSLLGVLLAAHVWLAACLTGNSRYWLDLVLGMPALWAALLACLAISWSWLFVALCARTPGMAATGQRLRMREGGAPRPLVAFIRAALAVILAAPGLLGFVLALFDPRRQTLHDRLTRSVVD